MPPGGVQLNEQLSACITRNVREPWQISSERREFFLLVEGGWVDPLTLGARKTHQPLLVSQVPEEAQRGLPRKKTSLLSGRRVDAEAVATTNKQATNMAIESKVASGLDGGRVSEPGEGVAR